MTTYSYQYWGCGGNSPQPEESKVLETYCDDDEEAKDVVTRRLNKKLKTNLAVEPGEKFGQIAYWIKDDNRLVDSGVLNTHKK